MGLTLGRLAGQQSVETKFPDTSNRHRTDSFTDEEYHIEEQSAYSHSTTEESEENDAEQLEYLADECMKREAFSQMAQPYGIPDDYFSQDLPMEESMIDDDYYSVHEKQYERPLRAGTHVEPVSTSSGVSGPKWQRGALIGAGSFGRVFLGLNLLTGEFMAVKQVELLEDQLSQHKLEVTSLQNEISVLQSLKHENIVQYLGSSVEGSCFNIFLEYVPGGSMASLIKKFGQIPENLIRVYTKQILTGLQYLHSNQIIHRDIKGANILVDNKGVIKLADFGASKKIEGLVAQAGVGDSIASLKGTVYWMAPEVIKQTGYGRQADIWSVGCTVIEMATGQPPWASEFTDQISALFTIATSNDIPAIPAMFSNEAKDFLCQCFKRNPKDRPNATKLLQHPWITQPTPRRLSSSGKSRPGSLNSTFLGTNSNPFSSLSNSSTPRSTRSSILLDHTPESLREEFLKESNAVQPMRSPRSQEQHSVINARSENYMPNELEARSQDDSEALSDN